MQKLALGIAFSMAHLGDASITALPFQDDLDLVSCGEVPIRLAPKARSTFGSAQTHGQFCFALSVAALRTGSTTAS